MRIYALMFLFANSLAWAQSPEPVIDMHFHTLRYEQQGPPPLAMCTPMQMPVWDQTTPYGETFMGFMKQPHCENPVWSPTSDEELMTRNLEMVRKYNIYGVASGTRDMVDTYLNAAPGRFLPGLMFGVHDNMPTPEQLVAWHDAGKLDVFGEITTQYQGILPDDPRLEPYWATLEEHDIPAGIHVGTGPPGVLYLDSPEYRGAHHSALTLEEVLAGHPRLRLYAMHAGFPFLDDLLATMYAHPQLHVGIGVIVHTQTRDSFYRYLKGLFDAGFGKRVMYGSDQMVWPETIERGIDVIRDAPFLSDEQKRDILFWNAARFLRLSDAEIQRMHNPVD